jgi:hypothetical protein
MAVDESIEVTVPCTVCGTEAKVIDIGEDGVELGYCREHSPDHLKDIGTATANWMGPRGTRHFYRGSKV